MTIKKAVNGKNLEYFTIKIPKGFSAYELAHYLLSDEGTFDDESVKNILAVNSYPALMKKVKDGILNYGLETPMYQIGDNWTGDTESDDALKTVADHIVVCAENKLSEV